MGVALRQNLSAVQIYQDGVLADNIPFPELQRIRGAVSLIDFGLRRLFFRHTLAACHRNPGFRNFQKVDIAKSRRNLCHAVAGFHKLPLIRSPSDKRADSCHNQYQSRQDTDCNGRIFFDISPNPLLPFLFPPHGLHPRPVACQGFILIN